MCGAGSEGWGHHLQALAASQILFFVPWPIDSVGFLCLLNLSLLTPEVPVKDTGQDILPAILFFHDPEAKLRGPLLLTVGKHGSLSE